MSWWGWFVVAYVAAVSIPLVVIDIREHRLPNRLVVPGVALAAACAAGELATSAGRHWLPVAGGVAYFVTMLVLSLVGGLGMGDVKLAAILGVSVGFVSLEGLVGQLVLTFLAGGFVALLFWVCRRRGNIPFGPFMLLGYWATLLAAATLWA
jgi:leader peptidase (prepilin peptidase)/N-methyltransferase